MLLPYIISGLVTGSVYGLAGTGLVLTYKTSGIFNFAYGALATVSAFLFYSLHVNHGVSWPLAAVICVLVLGPLLGLAFEVLARFLAGSSLAVRVASTVGILLIVQASVLLIYGVTVSQRVPQFLPVKAFHFGDTQVTEAQIIVFAFGLVATVSLYVFFRRARLGVAMRAVVDNPALLDLAGTSPVRVRRWAWIIGSTFAAACGLLLAPLLATLDATSLTFLVITAFGAAAVGGFTSLPLTYLGGIAIGIGQQLLTKYFVSGFWIGLSPSLPFVVLFVVLLISPRRRLSERSLLIPRTRSTWTAPWRVQVAGGVAILVVLAFVPSFAGIHLGDWTSALAIVVLFLSLGLLVRTSGQVSLSHVSFLAVGAVAMAHLAGQHHWPWFAALLVSGLIAVPVGALLSIPAIRFSGLYLALATFGFGILLQYMFYGETWMFGSNGVSLTVPRPHLSWLSLDSDKGYYYLVLALAVLATLAVVGINHSRLGRLLRGLADSPVGLATSGTSVNVTRVLVFCLSAFLAAVAGALEAASPGNISPDGYPPILSLTFFALIIISVGGEPWYALLAGGGLILVPSYVTGVSTNNYLTLLFGVGALLYAVTPDSMRGVPPAVARFVDRIGGRKAAPAHAVTELDAEPAGVRPKVAAGELSVRNVRVQFGGLVAVDGVTLAAPTGRITGLIGPNGAGKTTTFNACCGLNRPTSGVVELDGRAITRHGPAARARRGLGRTFQQMELFDSLTVRQNVALGMEGTFAGPNALAHLTGSRRQARLTAGATTEALTLCGLGTVADSVVGSLSTGQRRLVELARCLAGPYRILLLDEPSSGLDRVETARFGEILREVVRERGVGILLVEHDMSLVGDICDYLYVLDFGKQIFSGTAREVLSSPLVRAAYLGGDEVEEALEAPIQAQEVALS